MSSSYKSLSMVFDRAELRVLRAAYDQALRRLRQAKLLTEAQREDLARTVFEIGWARIRRGLSLSGAESLIANDVLKHLRQDVLLALCA